MPVIPILLLACPNQNHSLQFKKALAACSIDIRVKHQTNDWMVSGLRPLDQFLVLANHATFSLFSK